MITEQPVNDHDDMHNVTDNMLREVGLTIDDCGGKVTFAGAEPVRKTTMKAGAAPAIILAANAVAEAAIWKERQGEGQDSTLIYEKRGSSRVRGSWTRFLTRWSTALTRCSISAQTSS